MACTAVIDSHLHSRCNDCTYWTHGVIVTATNHCNGCNSDSSAMCLWFTVYKCCMCAWA